MTRLLLSFLLFAGLALGQAAHSVTLNWAWAQGTGGAATGFQVQRGTVSGGPYTTIGTVSSPTTLTYIDTSATGNILTEGQKYCYVVQATGPGGTSPNSTEACGTIPFSVPLAPSTLTVTVK
jgi:hypothetical protein